MRRHKTAPRRLPNDEARAQRMQRKRDFNETRHHHRQAYLKGGQGRVYANLSRWHPDYGMTPQQHEAQKALRKAGKVTFHDTKKLAARRGKLAKAYGL